MSPRRGKVQAVNNSKSEVYERSLTPGAFAKRLADLMPHLCRAMIRYESNLLTTGQITLPQFWALEWLRERGQSSMHDLAQALSMKSPAASMMADRLEELKLIRRARTPHDRRVVLVELTPRGLRMVTQVHEQKQIGIAQLFKALSARERGQYLNLVEKMARTLSSERTQES
jgi:DNA-binding MarR family transcriptional regulator